MLRLFHCSHPMPGAGLGDLDGSEGTVSSRHHTHCVVPLSGEPHPGTQCKPRDHILCLSAVKRERKTKMGEMQTVGWG